ncbi:MAG: kinase, partial [Nanohaloarchaea archaeon QH_8_44_6]
MIVSITGTPGTGKTSVSKYLKEFEVIYLTRFVKKHGLGQQEESEFEVDIPEMKKKLEKEIDGEKHLVIEGHLSHHFPSDYCVVLRCDPEELGKRLENRDYSDTKVEENIESEMLDVILTEAVGLQENIIEVDTTDREPE